MSDDSGDSLANSLSQIFTGAVITFGGAILVRVAGLLEKVLVARFFDPSGYDQVVLDITFLNLATLLGLAGLKTGIVRYLPRFDASERQSGTVYFVLQVGLTLGAIVSVVLFFDADWISTTILEDPEMRQVLQMFAIAVLPAIIGEIGVATAQGRKDARGKTLINEVLYPVSRVGSVAIAIVLGATVVGISVAYVAGYIIMATGAFYYIHRTVGLKPRSIPDRRKLSRFSLPLLFAGSMSFVSDSIDTLLLGYYLESSAIGIYNAAYPLANLVLLAPGLFSVVFVPMMSEYHADSDLEEMRRLYKITTRWTVCISLPGYLLMLLGPDVFIRTVFGEEYVGGAAVLIIVATGFIYHTILGINGGVLNMVGDSDFFLFSNFVNGGLNLLLNILLIPVIGITGAAIATAVSYSLANSIVGLRLYQKSAVHPVSNSLIVSIGIYLPIVFVMNKIVEMVVSGVLWVIVTYATSLALFVCGYYLLGLYTEEERKMVDQLSSQYAKSE